MVSINTEWGIGRDCKGLDSSKSGEEVGSEGIGIIGIIGEEESR